MDDVKCPRCRGQLEEVVWDGVSQPVMWQAMCSDLCGFMGPPTAKSPDAALQACAPLAYFDPRPRLPTPEEEAAHRERHGEGAGWMVSIEGVYRGDWHHCRYLAAARLDVNSDLKVLAYPHVNGRPVARPTPDARGIWNAMPPNEVK